MGAAAGPSPGAIGCCVRSAQAGARTSGPHGTRRWAARSRSRRCPAPPPRAATSASGSGARPGYSPHSTIRVSRRCSTSSRSSSRTAPRGRSSSPNCSTANAWTFGSSASRLPPEEALTVCAQVADALATAHGSGVVHRDVKPGNVMLAERGAVLLDFGISRRDSDTDLTGKVLIGTPACMAPEQWRGRTAQTASDVYALGCLLYWSLSGHAPYQERELPALGMAHLLADPPALPPVGRHHAAVDEVYWACMRKSPTSGRARARSPPCSRRLGHNRNRGPGCAGGARSRPIRPTQPTPPNEDIATRAWRGGGAGRTVGHGWPRTSPRRVR